MDSNATKPSAFLLLFRDCALGSYKSMSPAQRQQLLAQWNNWYAGLAEAGKVQSGHPLEPEVRIVSGPGGERVMDGPFAEAKEAVGGYFFLTVDSIEEATEIAKKCPSLPYGLEIEVRQVASFCPQLSAPQPQNALFANA